MDLLSVALFCVLFIAHNPRFRQAQSLSVIHFQSIELEQLSIKPNYLVKTDNIGFRFPIFWSSMALIWGVLFHEVSGAIFISTMSLFFVWLTYKLTSLFLSFQQHSGVVSNGFFDQVLKFIWFASAFGFLVSITYAVTFQSEQYEYYYVVFSIVSFGFALAAARKWACHYVAK